MGFWLALIALHYLQMNPPSAPIYGVLMMFTTIIVTAIINYAMNRWQSNSALVDRLLERITKVEKDIAAITGRSNGVNYRHED